jgi:hypothetical protein
MASEMINQRIQQIKLRPSFASNAVLLHRYSHKLAKTHQRIVYRHL